VGGNSCVTVALTASAARVDGGQRFGGFSGGNARELMNFGRRRVAFLGRLEYINFVSCWSIALDLDIDKGFVK